MKHGLTRTRIYTIWLNMKSRCYNKNNLSYCDYGAKGVVVCDRWLNSFELFYHDTKKGYKKHLTLDRFPNQDGNYEPSNFRWATQKEQQRNRRNNMKLTIDGETKLIIEWSEIYGINYKTILTRLDRGWNDKDAVTIGKVLSNKLVLDTQTGIYYDSATDAAKAKNIAVYKCHQHLSGVNKNKTGLIYV